MVDVVNVDEVDRVKPQLLKPIHDSVYLRPAISSIFSKVAQLA